MNFCFEKFLNKKNYLTFKYRNFKMYGFTYENIWKSIYIKVFQLKFVALFS